MPRILLVEDDDLIGTMVRLNLEAEGFTVTWLQHGGEADAALRADRFDALLLDIDLPGRTGVQIAQQARDRGVGTPIIMLTAMDATASKVAALEAGADDYVCKPFDIAELLARVRAQIRRSRAPVEIGTHKLIHVGGAELDLARRTLRTASGATVTASEKEAELIQLLVRNPGRILTRADILEEVWGMDVMPSERTVDNFIVRLRRWTEPEPDRPRHILTIRGAGYRYEP